MSGTHAAPRAAGPTPANQLARLRASSLGVVAMLIIQFILGMIYNLYGTAPTAKKSIGAFSSPVIALHVILTILLLIAAVAQLARAIGARHGLTIWMSAIGLVALLAAGGSGIGFINSGAAGASLGMSIAFAVALACYVVLVFALAPGVPGRSAGRSSGQSSTT